MAGLRGSWCRTACLVVCLVVAGRASAGLDLRNASVERLENGLTLILLDDKNFPVVSVQMLYRVGARNETTGLTGLAHFVEHMAFRESENFPGTGLVSSIYARGGEWHGYTWTDQTTYFATVPKEDLDLLLRIEADRMGRLVISPEVIEAERGAVLAEMHMYENSPTSMLVDALLFTSYIAHPYRNNTIGFESDIEQLTHADVVAFYEKHYHPGNAVLTVVGDFDEKDVRSRVAELFGNFDEKPATPLPHTTEPMQSGERRVRIAADSDVSRFMIGYHAPSANHPDFAAFLVLQQLLGGGSGVSFLQNDWGTAVNDESWLAGAAEDLTTWYPPSAQNYVFAIGGGILQNKSEAVVEAAVEKRITTARQTLVDSDVLEMAIASVLDELVYDVETTEDAAHQLAFFEGLGALDVLLQLPARVAGVSPEQVREVANAWLLPERRSVVWHTPRATTATPPVTAYRQSQPSSSPAGPVDDRPVPQPIVRTLSGGTPVVVQQSDLSASVVLQIVVPGNSMTGAGLLPDQPVQGYSSFNYRVTPSALDDVLARGKADLRASSYAPDKPARLSDDPETRLEQTFVEIMSASSEIGTVAPVLIVVSGDVKIPEAIRLLEKHFGDVEVAQVSPGNRHSAESIDPGLRVVPIGRRLAQWQLGYIVAAPGPRDRAYDTYRLLLYVLSHGYEGRLGVEAISKRGLAYYIDSRYRTDGTNGWITLAAGVDPARSDSLQDTLHAELRRLVDEPPSIEEIKEAKSYLLGRARSAAQSNAELAAMYAEQWVMFGELQTAETLARKLSGVSRRDVTDAIAEFIDGLVVVVKE